MTPLAHFEVEGPEIFGSGMCDRTAGFYHVLSVSVVPSVSVESAMESNDVLNDVFLRCVVERYDVSGQITRETRHTPASAPRGRPMLRDATSPSERSLRSQRFVVASGTPSAARDRHAFHGEPLLCGSHHVVRKLQNTCDFGEKWLVVYGYVTKSVMCVSVRCGKMC